MHRRDLLLALGSAAALSTVPHHRARTFDVADKLKRIGIQLYTVRQALEADFDGTLNRLAAIGYREVEFAWNRGKSPGDTKHALRNAGLAAPSIHLGVQDFESGWDTTVGAAETIGFEYLILAGLDADERKTLDQCHRWAERFNRFGEKCRAAGFQFGYHNHAGELTTIDGQRPYDILLSETDPASVVFEMDIYWMLEGGADPLAYFATWPGRFPLLHIKGRAADGQMVDVGAGSVDWAAMFAKSKVAGVRHAFVEHDDAADPFASAAASYQYLHALRFQVAR